MRRQIFQKIDDSFFIMLAGNYGKFAVLVLLSHLRNFHDIQRMQFYLVDAERGNDARRFN